MPIYEYLCEKCNQKFERLKSRMTSHSREDCPSCGGTANQQLSSFGVGSSASASPCADVGCDMGQCPGSGGGCPYSGM